MSLRAFRLSPKTVQFIAVGCAVAIVGVITWQIVVQNGSPVGSPPPNPDPSPQASTHPGPPTGTVQSPPSSDVSPRNEIYPDLDISGFKEDAKSFKPERGERLPEANADKSEATSDEPFFTMVASPVPPRTRTAASILTIGSFSDTTGTENSVFVGWVRDGNNYITAWYNHNSQESGINVKANGVFARIDGASQLTLTSGDQFALVVDDDAIMSFAHVDNMWKRLRITTIDDALTAEHHYGYGLRATSGTITVADFVGRSRSTPPG